MANDPRFNPQQAQPVSLARPQLYSPPQQQAQPLPNLGRTMSPPPQMQIQPVNLGQQGDMTGMHFSDPANQNAPIEDAHPQMFASSLYSARGKRQ
jgi:hypothetical protein